MQHRERERSICLTEDEAGGLLDIVLLYPDDLTTDQRAAMLKLSEFCREFLRMEQDSTSGLSLSELKDLAVGCVV